MAIVARALPQTSRAMSMAARPADRAIGAVLARRDGALDDGDVLALVVLDRLGQVLLGAIAGGGHDRLVVVDRERVEHDLGDRRTAGSQERLGVAAAVLELEPDEYGLLGLLDLGRDARADALRKRQRRGHHAAEAHEVAARNPFAVELLQEPVAGRGHGRCLLPASGRGCGEGARPARRRGAASGECGGARRWNLARRGSSLREHQDLGSRALRLSTTIGRAPEAAMMHLHQFGRGAPWAPQAARSATSGRGRREPWGSPPPWRAPGGRPSSRR